MEEEDYESYDEQEEQEEQEEEEELPTLVPQSAGLTSEQWYY